MGFVRSEILFGDIAGTSERFPCYEGEDIKVDDMNLVTPQKLSVSPGVCVIPLAF